MDFFQTLMVGTPTIKNTCCSKDKNKEVAQLKLLEKQMIKSATPVKQNQGIRFGLNQKNFSSKYVGQKTNIRKTKSIFQPPLRQLSSAKMRRVGGGQRGLL
jgi:hypothetical protein